MAFSSTLTFCCDSFVCVWVCVSPIGVQGGVPEGFVCFSLFALHSTKPAINHACCPPSRWPMWPPYFSLVTPGHSLCSQLFFLKKEDGFTVFWFVAVWLFLGSHSCAHLHTCTHTLTHRKTCMHIHTQKYICTCVHIHPHTLWKTCMHTQIHWNTHVCVYTCTHTHTHKYYQTGTHPLHSPLT